MAIGAGVSIGADAIAWRAGDKDLLIGRNWQRASTAVDPEWSTAGSWAGADETDAAGPTSYVYDDHDHLQTYPDANQATWYLLFDFGAAVGVIDSVVILNHNLNTASAVVDIQVDDDSTFPAPRTLESQTPGDDNRILFLDLDDVGAGQLQYSNVQYARIKMTTMGAVPKIGEVFWGQRRQLKHNSGGNWDRSNLATTQTRMRAAAGPSSRYTFRKGQRHIAPIYEPHETARIADLLAFFEEDTDFGRYPFLYVEQPDTDQNGANLMEYDNPEQTSALINGFSQRAFPIVATETGANFLALEP